MNGVRPGGLRAALLSLCFLLAAPALAEEPELSLSLIGTYRKVMEIEQQILEAAAKYDVSPVLARALCLYESGGNNKLTSHAGAEGYFQVMPGTFRRMGVRTNIEAGMKYLSQQLKRFRREDLALAAYNAGPGAVGRNRNLPLETVQYVLGIGNFKNVLLAHEEQIRERASRLRLFRVEEGDSWWSVGRRTGVPLLVLRFYNPFLSLKLLTPGRLIAYPSEPEAVPVRYGEDAIEYVTRPGDQYLLLAAVFGVPPDQIRAANQLWHVDLVLPGTLLEIPLARPKAEWAEHVVKASQDVGMVAGRYLVPVWDVIRDNRLWDQDLSGHAELRVDISRQVPRYGSYNVRRGDTLTGIARRHSVALDALRKANGFSRGHWRIRIGEVLRIPLN